MAAARAAQRCRRCQLAAIHCCHGSSGWVPHRLPCWRRGFPAAAARRPTAGVPPAAACSAYPAVSKGCQTSAKNSTVRSFGQIGCAIEMHLNLCFRVQMCALARPPPFQQCKVETVQTCCRGLGVLPRRLPVGGSDAEGLTMLPCCAIMLLDICTLFAMPDTCKSV